MFNATDIVQSLGIAARTLDIATMTSLVSSDATEAVLARHRRDAIATRSTRAARAQSGQPKT